MKSAKSPPGDKKPRGRARTDKTVSGSAVDAADLPLAAGPLPPPSTASLIHAVPLPKPPRRKPATPATATAPAIAPAAPSPRETMPKTEAAPVAPKGRTAAAAPPAPAAPKAAAPVSPVVVAEPAAPGPVEEPAQKPSTSPATGAAAIAAPAPAVAAVEPAPKPEPRPAAVSDAGTSAASPPPAAAAEPARVSAKAAPAKPAANAKPASAVDPAKLAEALNRVSEQAERLIADFVKKQRNPQSFAEAGMGMADPMSVGGAFLELGGKMLADPMKLAQSQMRFWQDYMALWQRSTERFLGGGEPPMVAPDRGDKRFRDSAWQENALFDFIKQSYLLASRWTVNTVNEVSGIDPKTQAKVDFFTRQIVDALSPSNFALTNPEVLRATVDSGGENLIKGLSNLLTDLERGKGKLAIRMTDTDAFQLGVNIATTPGKVVAETDLAQLIQYAPTTPTVHRRPLLIIPPWINKFYILDLKPENSFIRWAVSEGHTVFVLSWVNPDERHAQKSFSDYMEEGPLAALDAIERITGESSADVIGYCLGGTLLACTLAYLQETGRAARVASATFFTTLVDFSDVGEISVFIDEEQISALEGRMREKGYLPGDAMATTFNMLRPNDLIWSFVVSNYLLGKDPFPFDLLYWNSDSTRMTAEMHSFYLRQMYQQNRLAQPGGVTLKGVPLDLRQIRTPVFILSTRDDHIAPWRSTYAATRLYGGPVTFCLSGSGHIAGVVNPPEQRKYQHWISAAKPEKPEEWLAGAEEVAGSWWPEWSRWVAPFAGEPVPPRIPAPEGEDAPGSYVKG